MDGPTTAPPKPRRRRLALSLRAMMVLVLVAGGLMGWKARRAGLQRRSLEAIRQLRGTVEYDWQYVSDLSPPKAATGPAAPGWLRRAVGDEYFEDVLKVTIPASPLPPPGMGPPSEEDVYSRFMAAFDADQLACLDGLDRLESLRVEAGDLKAEGLERIARMGRLRDLTILGGNIDAAGLERVGRLANLESLAIPIVPGTDLASLERLTKLRSLQILQAPVDDAGLARIGRLARLKMLYISAPEATDAGLAHLKDLKELNSLSLQEASRITDAGLAHLEGLTELRVLALSGVPMNEAGLGHLRKLTGVRFLSLSKAGLGDEAIDEFKKSRPDVLMDFSIDPPR